MTKLPTYERIAEDYELQNSYLIRRCLVAEGKDPNDVDAMTEIIGAAQDAADARRK